jgi:hypothetical protein
MGAPARGVSPRRTLRSQEPVAAPEPSPWPIPAVARVLSALCPHPVSGEQVRDQAVGLGLCRLPSLSQVALLTAMAVSRLFLTGYRLPAAAELATVSAIQEHHQAGRRVFLTLEETTEDAGRNGSGVFELQGFLAGVCEEEAVLLGELGASSEGVYRLARTPFTASWAAAGNRLIVAARRWKDLPAEGPTFFAGYRGRDGSYHWNTAECDTDRDGQVLRY